MTYTGTFRDQVDQFEYTLDFFEKNAENSKLAISCSRRLQGVVSDLVKLNIIMDVDSTLEILNKYRTPNDEADRAMYEKLKVGLRLCDDLSLSEEEYARIQSLIERYDVLFPKKRRAA